MLIELRIEYAVWSTQLAAPSNVQEMGSCLDEYLWEGGSAHGSGKSYLERDVDKSPQMWLGMVTHYWKRRHMMVITLGKFEFHFRRMVVIQP
jgi:hypothetical protein